MHKVPHRVASSIGINYRRGNPAAQVREQV
jgi:hypothetical protein